jgi:hypothetical protein
MGKYPGLGLAHIHNKEQSRWSQAPPVEEQRTAAFQVTGRLDNGGKGSSLLLPVIGSQTIKSLPKGIPSSSYSQSMFQRRTRSWRASIGWWESRKAAGGRRKDEVETKE